MHLGPVTASIVFLFLTPREDDANNVEGVANGYRELAARHSGTVVLVPALRRDDTQEYIVETLREADLIDRP